MKHQNISKTTLIFYAFISIFILSYFLFVLYKPIVITFFEQDLSDWYTPSQFEIFTNNSFFKTILIHLFDPYQTGYFDPVPNFYHFLILSFFGPQPKYFIFTSIVLHFFISMLLFFIVHKTGLGLRVSLLSGLMYFGSFIHFCVYMWPIAAHHLSAIFFTLLVFYLYLETNERLDNNRPYRLYFRLTLFFTFISSFCAVIILILPAGILAHILFSPKDNKGRVKKYDMWLPLFIIYLGYPLIRMVHIGQFFLNQFFYFYARIPMLSQGTQTLMVYPILFVFGIISLFLFRWILKMQKYRLLRFLEWTIGSAIILLIFFYLLNRQLHRDVSISTLKRSFVSPYNFITPFVTALNFFLEPLKNVFIIESMRPYHIIPFKVNLPSILAALALIIIFLKKVFMKHKGLIIFVVIYFVALRLLWARVECPSRHMAYVLLLFCLVFSSSISYLYDIFMNKIRLKMFKKEIILVSVFTILCALNILSIRLEAFRGRLTNVFYIYDYIRAGYAIKNDIMEANERIYPEHIYINNVPMMPILARIDSPLGDFCCADPLKYDSFRFVLVQIFNKREFLNVNINKDSTEDKKARIYYMAYEKVNNINNINIEPFFYLFDRAVAEMERNNYSKALTLFQKAADVKPFLLRYILAKYKLGDLKWITNQMTLRPWVNKLAITHKWEIPDEIEKHRYNSETINREIDAYIQCLFFISYLEYRNGNSRDSEYWFSQLRYIENSYSDLLPKLKQTPLIRTDKNMAVFLEKFGSNFFYTYKDRHSNKDFYKFLLHLLFNYDIYSQYRNC